MPTATGERRASEDALQSVQAFLASDRAVQEKVDRLVGFLANDLDITGGEEPADTTGGDVFANEAQKKKNEQEALLKKLISGGASTLAPDSAEGHGAQLPHVAMLSNGDLVADGLANKQTEQEELLKKLTGNVDMATDDQDELVEQIIEDLANAPSNDVPSEESLLGSETEVQGNGQLNSESDPEKLVDQVIDALASTNDDTEEGALLTSEFNGEVNGGVSLTAQDTTTDDMVDQVTQYLANAKEPTSDEEALLVSAHSGEPDGLAQLLAKESATADEKADQLVAYFASANSTGKEPKPNKVNHKEASINEHDHQKEKHENPRGNNMDDPAVAALALEATAVSVAQQLRAPEATNLSLEQDHLPHMMFGGAFLLVVAVVLAVMTKRSRKTRPIVDQDEASSQVFSNRFRYLRVKFDISAQYPAATKGPGAISDVATYRALPAQDLTWELIVPERKFVEVAFRNSSANAETTEQVELNTPRNERDSIRRSSSTAPPLSSSLATASSSKESSKQVSTHRRHSSSLGLLPRSERTHKRTHAQAAMSVIEALQYLSRSEDGDDDASERRPTPLDPEYWRGITHSHDAASHSQHFERFTSPVATAQSHDAYRYASPLYAGGGSYAQSMHMYQRPVSASMHMGGIGGSGEEAYGGGSFVASPINFHSARALPVSPMTHTDRMHSYGESPMMRSCAGGFSGYDSGGSSVHGHQGFAPNEAEWGHLAARGGYASVGGGGMGSIPPQALKAELRSAFVRAQAFLDLAPFFQSCDHTYSGGIPLRTLQEGLLGMGVALSDPVLQSIGQLFSVPGSGLVDYTAVSRFLELDGQEIWYVRFRRRRDNMRTTVSARRSILLNSGVDLGQIFAQNDIHHSGFISRLEFASILRDYGVPIADTTLHFLMVHLSKPTDTTMVSYVRFLDMTGRRMLNTSWASGGSANSSPFSHSTQPSWAEGRSMHASQESYARPFEPPMAVPAIIRQGNFVDLAASSPDIIAPLPRHGWVCRVCSHQQIEDWVTHCEICETSKPRPGKNGAGFVKCSHCKFDNNYDMEECEMCGRVLNGNTKKSSKASKKPKYKHKRSESSSSSSSSASSHSESSSDSSSRSKRSSRSSRRKSGKKRSKSSSRSQKKEEKKIRFQRGEEVQIIPLGERSYQVGVVDRVRSDGTYDIEFDNGQYEKHVEDDRERFDSGDRIEARFQGGERFFAGVIKKCRTDGSYDIEYDDSEVELKVRSKYIRKSEPKSPKKPAMSVKESSKPGKEDEGSTSEASFAKGQRVEFKLKGKSDYVSGKIFRAHLDGTCDVELDSGDLEKHIPNNNIRIRSSRSPVKAKPVMTSDDEPVRPKRPVSGVKKPVVDSSSEDSCVVVRKYKEGDKIEAKHKEKNKYLPGTIARCRLNGSYDVEYSDEDKENAVHARLIRPRESSSPSKRTPKTEESSEDDRKKRFTAGQAIEAKYKGKDKYYPGTILRYRLNGTYDIDYDDGEKETAVAPDLIRAKASSPAKSKKAAASDSSESDIKPKKKFTMTQKVEAKYKGKDKFYPGVISRCRINGTYDIDYDDGEKETAVSADLIKAKAASTPPKKKTDETSEDDYRPPRKLKEGEEVEAQYKGKSKFYPGVISRCRLNGTYDIDYDDDEKEIGVAAELIRSKEASSPVKRKSDDTSEDDRRGKKKFKEGDKVEAQYKGKSKFYPGVISRCRLNGTYDINYDDGEKETGVALELIRLKGGASPTKKSNDSDDEPPKAKKFKESEKVEAQYKGKSKFYPGVISRCRLNGTYDIDYDDGEKETGVSAELIRSLEKKSSDTSEDERKPAAKKFKEGEKVEAQYKGKSKLYPGVITRCRLNGTYDIDYDDGEKETGVVAELIRSKESSGDAKKKSGFKEGDKVEAQYKGKPKFYPGVITRCRLNGTFDIDYDDGEKETGVAAELIRSLAKETATKMGGKESPRASSFGKESSQAYRVGARVEALYMGKDKWFKGTVSRAHADGSCDIEYDDGDKENKVPSRSIRPLKAASSFSATAQFSAEKPVRPSPSGGARRRSGSSSD